MRLAVLLLLIAPPTGVAAAQESFDGAWRGVITCAPHAEDGGARGYSYGFPAQVKNGVFHAERKAEDAPGSLRIDGPIQPDGNADLIAKGLTGHPDNAVGHHDARHALHVPDQGALRGLERSRHPAGRAQVRLHLHQAVEGS